MSKWNTNRLGDIAIFKNGKSRPADVGDIPVYGGNGILDYTDKSNSEGEVVIVGRVGAYCGSIFYENKPIWVSDNAMYALPKNNYNTKYLYYLLKKTQLNKYAQGSSHPLLTQTLLNDIEVIFNDDIHEQQEIASILASLDDKIELNLQMNQTLETMAQAIFKEWFVNFNFPGFDGELVDDLPKGWREWNLKDFGKIVCGKTPSKAIDEYFGGEYMFLKIPDMHNSVFVIETSDTLTKEGLQSQSNKTLPPYSVCVSSIATVGLVCMNPVPCQTNQQINSIIPSEPFWKYYIFFLSKSMREAFAATASGGTATLNMNTSQFSVLKVIKPADEILYNFDEIVGPLMERILANEYEIKSLTQIRDGLLPKIMTGKIEVKE